MKTVKRLSRKVDEVKGVNSGHFYYRGRYPLLDVLVL